METDFLAILGVSTGVVSTIIGIVQLVKHFFKDKISEMVDADKKKLDIFWIVLVGILAVLGAAGVVGVSGWSWTAFAPWKSMSMLFNPGNACCSPSALGSWPRG